MLKTVAASCKNCSKSSTIYTFVYVLIAGFNLMSIVENIDVNKVKITFSVDAAKFEEGLKYSYNKNKKFISIAGFRKGKAPRKIIEAQYGKGIFYDDAINFVLPEAYENAVKENSLDVVSKPSVDIKEIDENKGVEFTAEVYIKPEVKISDYKGLTYTKKDVNVSEEEIIERINAAREKSSRIINITDRPVAQDDIVTIDFEGFIDGVAFEGGKGTNYQLKIGSHTFIDNFEDQLIGKNINDNVDVNVTFPEDYGKSDLAGKPAVFKVKINSIKFKELPELNDEFVSDTTEFGTVDEYKNNIREKLLIEKNKKAEDEKREELLEKLIEKAEMNVPDAMIENEIDNKINEFKQGIQRQGLSLDKYLEYMGQSIENMREAYRIVSEKQVKGRLALEAIAANENFEITEEELDTEIERIAKSYQMNKEKFISVLRDEDKESLKKDLQVQKALELVTESSVEA